MSGITNFTQWRQCPPRVHQKNYNFFYCKTFNKIKQILIILIPSNVFKISNIQDHLEVKEPDNRVSSVTKIFKNFTHFRSRGNIYIGLFRSRGNIYIGHFRSRGNICISLFRSRGNVYIGYFRSRGKFSDLKLFKVNKTIA